MGLKVLGLLEQKGGLKALVCNLTAEGGMTVSQSSGRPESGR